jgi:hypothetical protein
VTDINPTDQPRPDGAEVIDILTKQPIPPATDNPPPTDLIAPDAVPGWPTT